MGIIFFKRKKKEAPVPPPPPSLPAASSEKLALASFNNLLLGAFVVNTQTNTLPLLNPTAKRMLGIQAATPSLASVINALPPTYDLQKQLKEAVASHKPGDEKEITLEEKTFAVSVVPVSTVSAAVLLRDITFEASLQKVKEDFIHMMVHELRAPLTAIKGAAQILEKDKSSKQDFNKMISIIQEQSKKLLDQVSSLLDLAKIEASRFVIQKTPSDVKKLVSQVAEVFQPQAVNKSIALTAKIGSSIPLTVVLDPIRIGQVLNNFVSNSLKFTPAGGAITIEASISKETPKKLTVKVKDTGVGIPKEKQKEIFAKFYQVGQKTDDDPNTHIPGTGLGLYIAKQIIEAHKGTIDLVSDEGKGTTISFSIPL